jgi:uncharacterized membrane-anchored protein
MRKFRIPFRLRFPIALMTFTLAALLAAAMPSAQVRAQESGDEMRRNEVGAACQAGADASTAGPANVKLIDQAVIELPKGYAFVPKAEGGRILRAMGNTVSDPQFVGLLVGTSVCTDWIIVVDYTKEGYVKDEEARNWNADELLRSLKEGTEEANKDRVERGFPEIEVVRWIEPPAYDATTHRLVWSMLFKHKGDPDSAAQGVNYNTYALGRDGYFSLNLLTTADDVREDKVAAHQLLGALGYSQGKRYEDFNASTDHIAEYGIAALIVGAAAKKFGLFAAVGLFVLKFAKLFAIGAVALGAGVLNFVRRFFAKNDGPTV